MSIIAQHETYLQDRAVPPGVAKERGYRSVLKGKPDGSGQFAADYGFPRTASGLLIPLHPLLGEAYQLRRFDEGAPRKFETPKGQRNVLATSPLTRDLLPNPRQLVFVCEGVTRVDALAAYGVPAVGITGAWGWRGRNDAGGLTALQDWESVNVKGNRFVLAFDADVRTKRNVNAGAVRLAQFLTAKGADSVQVLALPEGQGLDDYIAASAPRDASDLAECLRPYRQELVPTYVPPAPVDDNPQDDAGPWARSADGDIWRTLAYAPERLCVVRDHEGQASLLVEAEGGRWTRDAGEVDALIKRAALDWQARITADAQAGKVQAHDAQRCTAWAIKAANPAAKRAALESLRGVVATMQMRKSVPNSLTIANAVDVDADKSVLGTPDGVLDLATGKLLPPEQARKRLVTRSVRDPYKPAARHAVVDGLTAHLGKDAEYIRAALRYALGGNPARRLYILTGPRGGRKSTLLEAVNAALGDVRGEGYGMALGEDAILAQRFSQSHQGGTFGLQHARIAIVSEVPVGRRLNVPFLKAASGGDSLPWRDVGEKASGARSVSATIFIALNEDAMLDMPFSDAAFQDRTKILPYPQPDGAADPRIIEQVKAEQSIRQALLAWVLGGEHSEYPPADVSSVAEAVRERADEAIGEGLRWLREHTRVTGYAGDRLTSAEIWEAACRAAGVSVDSDSCEGRTKRELLAVFRGLVPGLPVTVRGEYRGVTFADAPEDAPVGGLPVVRLPAAQVDGPSGAPVWIYAPDLADAETAAAVMTQAFAGYDSYPDAAGLESAYDLRGLAAFTAALGADLCAALRNAGVSPHDLYAALKAAGAQVFAPDGAQVFPLLLQPEADA